MILRFQISAFLLFSMSWTSLCLVLNSVECIPDCARMLSRTLSASAISRVSQHFPDAPTAFRPICCLAAARTAEQKLAYCLLTVFSTVHPSRAFSTALVKSCSLPLFQSHTKRLQSCKLAARSRTVVKIGL